MWAELFGWIGCMAFSVCAVPQAYRSWKDGNSDGLDSVFLALWLVGEVSFIAAVLLRFGLVLWLVGNYVANLVCLLVIIRYRIWPRRKSNKGGGDC